MAQLSQTNLFTDANLVSYYELENVNDNKGSNNLTNNNSITFVAAKYNNGANTGASNANKSLSVLTNMGIGTGAFTICGWFKMITEPSNATVELFALRTSLGGANLGIQMIYQDSAGTKSFTFDRAKLGTADQGPNPTISALGTSLFHHIAFTYDGSNIHGYLDGVDITGASAASGSGANAPTDKFEIFADGTGSGESSAIGDDVAIFSRALTANEIRDLASEFLPGYQGIHKISQPLFTSFDQNSFVQSINLPFLKPVVIPVGYASWLRTSLEQQPYFTPYNSNMINWPVRDRSFWNNIGWYKVKKPTDVWTKVPKAKLESG